MPDSHEPQFDRYLQGTLTSGAARELAQKALDSPALFEELSLAAVAIHGAGQAPSAQGLANAATFPRRSWTIAFAAAAAGIAIIAAYVSIRAPRPDDLALIPRPATSTASLNPSAGKPILLAGDLTSTSAGATTVFRSAETDSRAPQPSGAVVELDNLTAIVSLGSIDGLQKGTELEVFRGASREPIGRITIDTVFRDRARGTIASGTAIQPKDRVQPSPSVYLGALLEHMNSLASRGDPGSARKGAREALTWAHQNSVSPGATRPILVRLGALDYQAGDLSAAEADYRAAIQSFNSPPAVTDQSQILNSLGTLLLLRGDTAGADAQFRQVTPPGAQVLNNLGVSAELRGDKRAAESFYRQALRAEDSQLASTGRQNIEVNLARVSGAAHENR